MIDYFRNNRGRVIFFFVWGFSMVLALAFFYFLKSRNEYYISLNSKFIIVGCIAGSSLLILMPSLFKKCKWIAQILELLAIFGVSYFLFAYLEPLVNDMEVLNSHAKNINILIIFSIIVFFYGIFQNVGYGIAIGGLVIYFLFIIDYYTFGLRGTPFVLSDLFSAKTALGVMPNYTLVVNERMVTCFFILALLTSIGGYISSGGKKKLHRIIVAISSVAAGATLIILITFSEIITQNRFTALAFVPSLSARQNGFLLNTVCALKTSFIKEPLGYSSGKVSQIISENSSASSQADAGLSKPNIIVIMNESLTDFDYLLNVQTTDEPLPKFKAMRENCVRGTLISSIYGGNTPNSEFEFLTGCSLAFLPQGVVTYQQMIDHELPTFVTHLKDLGYSASAIHLYNPEYFSRSRIYPLLGFDEFININNTTVQIDIIGDYATDESSFRAIKQLYENSDGNPFFAFCVTIQNHGGYWHWGRDILVTNANSDYANDYATLLRKTDNAFADLIEYFSEVNEPTLVVMFGDHQPNLFDDFYNAIWDGYTLTEEEKTYLKAKVPFIIWANYDIEEAELDEMSINYLGPTILRTAGLPLSDYQLFLENLRDSVPVISAVGFVDSDGNHFTDISGSPYAEELSKYEYLEYYYLKKNSNNAFYK